MKKLLSLILALTLLLTGLPFCFSSFALGLTYGACGETASWNYNQADATLTVSGSGAMFDFDDGVHTPEWAEYTEAIKHIVIENGITTVGNAAFMGLPALTAVTLPDTLTDIGKYAFCYDYSLQTVTLPKSLRVVHTKAFCGCVALSELIFENGLSAIGDNCFAITYFNKLYLPSTLTQMVTEGTDGTQAAITNVLSFSLTRFGMLIQNDSREVCLLADTPVKAEHYPYLRLYAKWLCDSVRLSADSADNALANAVTELDGTVFDNSQDASLYTLTKLSVLAQKCNGAYYFCPSGSNQEVLCKNSGIGCSEAPDTYGVCSDNTYWLYYSQGGLLKLAGNGVLPNYSTADGFDFPWKAKKVQSVVIEKTVQNAPFDCEILGHDVQSGSYFSCTENSYIGGRACLTCEKVLIAPIVIPPKGHSEAVLLSEAPTCTQPGLTEGVYCTVCGTVLIEQEDIPAPGHTDADNNGICDICGTEISSEEPSVFERIRRLFATWIDKLLDLFRRLFG